VSSDDPAARTGYAEVRGKLRERGYLDGGMVERFLLRDLLASPSGLLQLPRTALKAALIGAPLLGALLAGAAALANRPLVGGRDLALLWLWFALLSGGALFLLDLAAASIAVALARRRGARPGDARRAALLVGLPTLAYLVLLWSYRLPGAGLGGDLVFLGLAVLTTLLVARLAGLVSLAGIVGRTGEVPARSRRAASTWVLALVVAAACLVAARALTGSIGEEAPPASFEISSAPERLVVIGIDGLDADLLEALEPRGAVGRILAGMARSAVFPLTRAPSAEPPEVWTTLMTGVEPGRHGVISAGVETLPGVRTPLRGEAGPLALVGALRFLLPTRTVPTTAAGRRHRTLWEIVSLRRPVVAVGWWASWPAVGGEQSGYVVTDRVLPKLTEGASGDRDTAPPALFRRLAADFPEDREALSAEFRLPGLDILRRRLAERTRPDDLAGLIELQEALESYVGWLDGVVGSALEPAGQETIVAADPGRSARPASEGFLLVRADGAEVGCVGPTLGPLDLAPVALGLAGFPESDEMPGELPPACLEALGPRPSPVATYGRRRVVTERPTSEYDDEMLEHLRSLGYLN
jgi:hypothetical protein